ncbi:MAG: hypothetical protein IPP60_15715 [Sphingobacteriales bacterium]|nr:hypothetical protein [Sphingobacteriales bacterium]
MEPISIIALSAAIGGGAGKFAEKAWDSGEKWLKTFFKDHNELVQQKANENSLDFLSELAQRIKKLEDQNKVSADKIIESQNQPDFTILLQKAIITASQTDNKEKHVLLATLVTERLTSSSESIFTLTSKMACDTISYLTVNQIKILGFLANAKYIRPNLPPIQNLPINIFHEFVENWITSRLTPYHDLTFRSLDFKHLESLSCLRIDELVYCKFDHLFNRGNLKVDFTKIKNRQLYTELKTIWDNSEFESSGLTTLGQLIGIIASDNLSKTYTDIGSWK